MPKNSVTKWLDHKVNVSSFEKKENEQKEAEVSKLKQLDKSADL